MNQSDTYFVIFVSESSSSECHCTRHVLCVNVQQTNLPASSVYSYQHIIFHYYYYYDYYYCQSSSFDFVRFCTNHPAKLKPHVEPQ